MINIKRGAGVWYAYDITAISTAGKKYRQSYYEDELEVAKVDAETLKQLGYKNVVLKEREWHKKGARRY